MTIPHTTPSLALPDATAWSGMTVLNDLVPVQLSGPDAVTFLHSQITQDVTHLTDQVWRLGGHCSAKGRLQASFYMARPEPDQLMLLADTSLLPAWLKRLQMFVLRAKVTLTDMRPDWQVLGVVGTASVQQCWGDAAAALPVNGLFKTNDQQGLLLRLPDAQGCARFVWTGPAAALQTLAPMPTLPDGVWAWLDVMSGVPRITQATVDQFVPQMVNFELLDGVNFQKGCYPGQEVVARSQYRGTIKRRLFVVHADGPLTTMQDIYAQADPAQPAGVIVNAAPIPGSSQWSALAELKLAHAVPANNPNGNDTLHLGQADGPVLHLGALPYPLPDLTTDQDTATASATIGA
jgi:tRNA-modifying protein YgfZ